jgi:hypothetical protein
MADQYLFLDAAFVKAEIGKLLAEYPELEEDDILQADAIEGETDAMRIIERALNEQREAETMVGAIKAREVDIVARRFRYERKSDAMRQLIKAVMKAAKLDKVSLPDASLSLTKGRQTVGIDKLEDLPQGYFKTIRQADKAAIKASFDAGQPVPGAILVTGAEGLTIRTK